MKRFFIGGLVGALVIALGVGMMMQTREADQNESVQTDIVRSDDVSQRVAISVDTKEEKKGNVTYSLTLPRISGAPILEKNIREYVDGFVRAVEMASKDVTFEGASSEYSLSINHTIIRNDALLTVIRMSAYEFTGGAHGNPSFAFFMYDPRTMRMVGEDEIFKNRKDEKLLSIVSERLKNNPQYSFEDGGTQRSYFFDVNDQTLFLKQLSEGNIALTKNGVLFKYGTYALGPYVIGEPEVEIPASQLQDFLTPLASQLLK